MVATTSIETPHSAKSIAANLQPSVDWTKRVEALQAIAEWAETERTHSSHSFVNGIHQLRDAVAEQVVDLRSAVVKEACATIAVLATTMKEAAFQTHVDVFLTALLKALVVTVEVISTAADTCIRTILQSTRTGHYAALPKLVEAANSKSAPLRRFAIEYFGLICAGWHTKSMLRHQVPDAITKLLLLGLCDGNGTVRSASRKTFWTFHSGYSGKARLVYDKLDHATKHLVVQDGTALGLNVAAVTDDKPAKRLTSVESGCESELDTASSSSSSRLSLQSVFARLYQPHYFQDRLVRLAKLKEARDRLECTFVPAKTARRPPASLKQPKLSMASAATTLASTMPPPPPVYTEAPEVLTPVA